MREHELGRKYTQKKSIVIDTTSELYYDLLAIYLDEYNKIPASKKENLGKKDSCDNLPLDDFDYSTWFEESDDVPSMLTLEGDEEAKEGKGLKISTPNKLLTRFPVLRAKTKAENLNKLKNEIRQILYLLYKHNKITKHFYSNLVKSF